jgi:hypothetical protein
MVINVLIPENYNNTLDGTSGGHDHCERGYETTDMEKNPTGFQKRLQSPGSSVIRCSISRGALNLSARRKRTPRWDSSWKGKGTICSLNFNAAHLPYPYGRAERQPMPFPMELLSEPYATLTSKEVHAYVTVEGA